MKQVNTMAKKNEPVKKNYQNPTKTPIGKTLIIILAAAMGLASFALLIYYIVIMVMAV